MKTLPIVILLTFLSFAASAQIITTYAGTGTAAYTGDGGQATNAQMYSPWGLVVDNAGNLYIAEQINHIIRKVAPDGNISTFAGNGTAGNSGDGGPATAAKLGYPYAIALDHNSNVFFTDHDNSVIRKVDNLGIITTVPIVTRAYCPPSPSGAGSTLTSFNFPCGIAIDDSDNIYFTNVDRDVFRSKHDTASLFAGNCVLSYYGDRGPATNAALNNPRGLAFDRLGNLYIGDEGNNVVRKVDRNGFIYTFAGSGGAPSFHGDGGQATAAGLNGPMGVATDSAGNVYIQDMFNRRIRKVNTSGIISTIAGNGVAAYAGDGGPATTASFYDATGLTVDRHGSVYISDLWYSVVRKITYVDTATHVSHAGVNNTPEDLHNFSIYPNPSHGVFYVKTTVNATPGDELNLDVYNLNAQCVYHSSVTASQSGIEATVRLTDGLPPGIYVVHLSGKNDEAVGRLVLEK